MDTFGLGWRMRVPVGRRVVAGSGVAFTEEPVFGV